MRISSAISTETQKAMMEMAMSSPEYQKQIQRIKNINRLRSHNLRRHLRAEGVIKDGK